MRTKNTGSSEKQSDPKPTRPRLPGFSRLSRACETILRNDGDRIANALLQKAVEGNVSSAKLLVKIIELEAQRLRTCRRQAAKRKLHRQQQNKKR